MSTDRATALDEALSRLLRGESIESCLDKQDPDVERELKPMLQLAEELQKLSVLEVPSSQAMAAARQRMLSQAVRMKEAENARQGGVFGLVRQWFHRSEPVLVKLVSVLLVMALVGGGTITIASASSLPGDVLYPVKLFSEDIQLLLALNPMTRMELQGRFDLRRREEVAAVTSAQRSAVMSLRGRVDSIAEGAWVVWGLTLNIDQDTRVGDGIDVDTLVQVRLRSLPDGSLLALEIVREADGAHPTATPGRTPTTEMTATMAPAEATSSPTPSSAGMVALTSSATPEPTATRTRVPTSTATAVLPTNTPAREIKVVFSGMIESIEEQVWRIGGQLVYVNSATVIDDSKASAQTGTGAMVVAVRRTDGTLLALSIATQPAPEPELIEFQAQIELWGPTQWVIGGRVVLVLPGTTIEGNPEEGLLARVRAWKQANGELHAERITVVVPEEVQFEGRIAFIGTEYWVVEGTTVRLDAYTSVTGNPAVGATVEVQGVLLPDGSVLARSIVVVRPPEEAAGVRGVSVAG